MELLFVITVIAGLVFFISIHRKDDQRTQSNKKIYDPRTQSIVNAEHPFETKPFDEKAKTSPPERITLQGPAYVVDGDTLIINKVQIRLFGIDAPEIDHPFGRKAKWALVSICKGQAIRAEVTDMDDHGRTVAKCYLGDGRDLSEEMVKAGLAIDWPKFSGGIYRHFEVEGARKKMWLADARQRGRMDIWEKYETQKANQTKG